MFRPFRNIVPQRPRAASTLILPVARNDASLARPHHNDMQGEYFARGDVYEVLWSVLSYRTGRPNAVLASSPVRSALLQHGVSGGNFKIN